MKPLLMAACAVACSSPSWARADEITLEGGIVVQGRIELLPEGRVRLQVGETRTVLPASRVLRVVPAPLPEEVYVQRMREQPPGTATEHLELARWCRARGLASKASLHWTEALKLDPDCEEALLALGYRKVEGIWVSAQEFVQMQEARRADEARKARALAEAKRQEAEADRAGARKVRVAVPMVTLELRPTLAQVTDMRNVRVVGNQANGLDIEAPTVRITSVRTTAQVPGGP